MDRTASQARRADTVLCRARGSCAWRRVWKHGGTQALVSRGPAGGQCKLTASQLDLVERASADRGWTYRHVVVDEAQELSEMDWRVLMRRCPGRSFTVVGDLAQRRSPAGATSWGEMLDPYVPGRWEYRSLTVNYRTPAEIMAVAAQVLAEFAPDVRARNRCAPTEFSRSRGRSPSTNCPPPSRSS